MRLDTESSFIHSTPDTCNRDDVTPITPEIWKVTINNREKRERERERDRK